jgi:hypothetical protein
VTPERIAFVLTALAAVVVVLTRVRMASGEEEAAGRLDIPRGLVNVHTIFGVLALLLWGTFLLADVRTVVGWVGLACWWITTVAGLLILLRWLPARGRHASGPATDSWGEGPGLSVLGHVGLLVGSIIWTYMLIADKLT